MHQKKEKELLEEFKEKEVENWVLQLIETIVHDETLKQVKGKGTSNMCELLQEMRADSRNQGIMIGKEQGFMIGKEQGFMIGKEQGFNDGIQEGIKLIILNLLKAGLDIEKIHEYTQEPLELIQSIYSKQFD